MANNKIVRIGPVAITNAVTNFFNPGTTTGGVNAGTPQNLYAIIKHIRITNKTGAGVNVSLWIGATGASAAGTEFGWSLVSVPANSFVEMFCQTRMDVADFLTMLAGANTALTIEADVEIGLV